MTNTINTTIAQTNRIDSNQFVGENGLIDTGFTSFEIRNDTAGLILTYYVQIINVTSGNQILNSSQYNVTWSYFQSSARQNITYSTSSGIIIEVDQDGYWNNRSSLVWRLEIQSSLDYPISVHLNKTVSFRVIVILTPEGETTTEKTGNSILALVIAIGIATRR